MNAAVIAEEASAAPAGVPWVAFVLVLVTLISVPNIARLVRWIVPNDAGKRVGWRSRHLVAVVVIFVGASLFVPRLVSLPHEGLGLLELSALATVPPIACVLIFANSLGPRRLCALGFRAGNFLRAPLAGVIAYVLMAPGLFALGDAWMWTLGRIGVEAQEQSIIRELRSIEGSDRWIAVVLGVGVVPLFEEILFRGFLQPLLVQKLRPAAGIALTSALFAILHGVSASVPIFALSCLLGYVMLRTQRLHAAWTIHALHNGLQFLALYVFFPEMSEHAAPAGGLVQLFTR